MIGNSLVVKAILTVVETIFGLRDQPKKTIFNIPPTPNSKLDADWMAFALQVPIAAVLHS